MGAGPTALVLLAGSPPIVLAATPNGLAAFRSNGQGFEPGPRSAEGRSAQVLVAGPLGSDGSAAVAFASREAARVAIAPVDRSGAIGAAESIALPALPRAARVAALGPAGPAALLVAHDGGLSVIMRGADGWQRRELAIPPFARDFAVADLDGDGRADLVAVDETTNQLVVLHGTGEGNFAAGGRLATVRAPQRLVAADVNGDGRPDLLVIGNDGLALHLAQAAGGFGAPQLLQRGDHLADVAAADVNGDGRIDLAVLDRSRSTLTFLLGANGGRFAEGESYLVGYGAEVALVADLDGDGQVDALVLNRLGNNATWLHGLGGGAFDGVVCLRSDIGELTAVTVADFDRDDRPDLAVASADGGRVGIFLGRGDGRFRTLPPLAVGPQPRALVAGDFNQDDLPDLAVVNFGGDTVAVLQGDGHGGFTGPRLYAVGTGPTAISTGSFGADTSTDLAVVNSLSDSVSVLYSDGHGKFPTVATFPVAARPSFLIVGDTNRDGHQDLVVGSQFSESVAILLGDGHKLGAPTSNKLSGTARPSLAEDFDRDGQMDLVNPDEAAGVVEILPGTAPGEFGTPIRVSVGRDPHVVATGDFDGDGRTDIAVVHRATQTIAILLNRSPKPLPVQRSAR